MSNDPKTLAIVPTDIDGFGSLAARFAKSSLIPDALKGKEADVFVTLLAGHEIGLAPMASLRGIHVIKGKPILTADTMVALVLASGACEYFILVEGTDDLATYETKRKDAPRPLQQTWTIADAKRAELMSNDNWRKNPRAMLRARAKSILARDVYPDVLAGCYEEGEADEIRGTDGAPTGVMAALPNIPTKSANVEPWSPPAAAKRADAVPAGTAIDPPTVTAPVFDVALAIATSKTVEELVAVGKRIGAELPEAERAKVKPSYEARLAILRGPDPFAAFLADLGGLLGADCSTWTADDVAMEYVGLAAGADSLEKLNAATAAWLTVASKPGRGPQVRGIRATIEHAAEARRAELRAEAAA